MDIENRRSPELFSIAPGISFIGRLSAAIVNGDLGRASCNPNDPFSIARATIFLPTQRACKCLRGELIDRFGGSSSLLPRLSALGDIEGSEFSEALSSDSGSGWQPLPSTLSDLERQLILTRLILGRYSKRVLGTSPLPTIGSSPAHAARLAADLARLMDAVENEGLDFSNLHNIVPGDHSAYWETALDFLRIIMDHWPAILAERGVMSPVARRNALLTGEAEYLMRLCPSKPVIVAGSTGSLPATVKLISAVSLLPQGAIVLPGLDFYMDDKSWDLLSSQAGIPSHPQYAMSRLLRSLDVQRQDVCELGILSDNSCRMRTQLISEAMRPAASLSYRADYVPSHQASLDKMRCVVTDAVYDGLTYVQAANMREEALVIALMMREVAEHPDRTIALVTPDRTLARCVVTELARWDIVLDDSAGLSLGQTSAGRFALLSAELLFGKFASIPLLSVLKHHLCHLGEHRERICEAIHVLEMAIFRGSRLDTSLDGLRAAFASRGDIGQEALDLINHLELVLSSVDCFPDGELIPFNRILSSHEGLLRALIKRPSNLEDIPAGSSAYGADVDILLKFFSTLSCCDDASFSVLPADYPSLLSVYLSGKSMSPARATHPRLFIWGLLEARLMHVDRLVLSGLNEGTWPACIPDDPWLNRSMRQDMGFSTPEWRVGLMAHDFTQAFAKRDIVLTRSLRMYGTLTQASRWLFRLDTALRRHGIPDGLRSNGSIWLHRAQSFLDSGNRTSPLSPPCPCPPLSTRPRSLSVTQVETWIRDPYAFYAQHILGLKPLEPLEAVLDGSDRGMIIHDILAQFMSSSPDFSDFQCAMNDLLSIGKTVFSCLSDAPDVKRFWWLRFLRLARWFVEFEMESHQLSLQSYVEMTGTLRWGDGETGFTLTARADRIDKLCNGKLAIYDYKTGQIPSKKEVSTGLSPQLPLEAAIAHYGGFSCIPLQNDFAPEDIIMGYIRLSGGTPPGSYLEIKNQEGATLHSDSALQELQYRVASFNDPKQCYCANIRLISANYLDMPYDHLSRVREWMCQTQVMEEERRSLQ